MKWALHLAIAAAADASVFDTLIGLTIDRSHERNRAMFVDAPARLEVPRTRAALDELADDPALAGDVQRVTERTRRQCRYDKDARP
jgi:hypothetical protein